MGFNEAQQIAISHKDGAMMVLAGPGSGKTRVITYRTRKLIEEDGIDPSHILVITFTKAAAQEMQSRFFGLTQGANYPVTFGTFHSVFFRILKWAYHLTAENILREDVKIEYLKQIISGMQLEIDDEAEFFSGIISEISNVKGDMVPLEHYYSQNCSEENFRKIFTAYDERLRSENLLDFDDMLLKCYELLEKRPDILKLWQDKYRYILIDEFQDINRVQYEVVRLLAAPQNNLFIVGDDDQSIYRFRGAKPEIMLNFTKDYPEAKQVLLAINYRSTGEIVKHGLRVIGHNKKRFPKKIETSHPGGEPVVIQEFATEEDQMRQVISEIQAHVKAGGAYKDMAFLFRTNTGPRLLVAKLMEYNIPFHMKDSLPNLYEHWIAKDVLAYIRLAMGSRERGDFLRIINKPSRYIARNALKGTQITLNQLRAFYQGKDWMWDHIDKLEYDLGFMAHMSPYAAISYIRSGIDYDAYLKKYADFRRMKEEELYQVLDELAEEAKPYKTYEEWFIHIDEYYEKLKEQARKKNLEMDSVEIATMHSAKGLEYDNVYILDANETIMPHQKATLPEDLEEERRLFYVAVTRAKNHLAVYSVKEKYNKPLSVSRFVGEMLMDPEQLKEGARVVHKRYKEGTIMKVTDGKMTIYFDKLKKQLTFDMKYAVANRLIEAAKEQKNTR